MTAILVTVGLIVVWCVARFLMRKNRAQLDTVDSLETELAETRQHLVRLDKEVEGQREEPIPVGTPAGSNRINRPIVLTRSPAKAGVHKPGGHGARGPRFVLHSPRWCARAAAFAGDRFSAIVLEGYKSVAITPRQSPRVMMPGRWRMSSMPAMPAR